MQQAMQEPMRDTPRDARCEFVKAIPVPCPPRSKLAVAALALAGLLLAAVASQPWWLAPLVARQLSASSGRAVAFDALWVGFSFALEPVVHVRGARIENAAWADATRPFMAVSEAAAVVSWRSVVEHRPVIALLVLRDGSIDLERQADGLRNWRLQHPEDRGPGRYKLLALEAHRSTIRFVHRGIDLVLEATATANDAGATSDAEPSLPTHLDLNGTWRELPFTASLVTGEVLTFLETGRSFPLRGRLDAGGVRLDASGSAGDIFRLPSIDAHVALSGDSLLPFRAFTGSRQNSTVKKAFRVDGHLKADGRSFTLAAMQAHIGATDLAGELGFTRGEERNAMRATLRSTSADLDDLMWLAGRGSAPPGRVATSDAPMPAPAATATHAFDFSHARSLDAELDLDAKRLHAADYPMLQSLHLQAVLKDGLLTVSDVDVGLAQGHASGQGVVDMRAQAASVEATLALRGLRVENLWRDQAENKRITGELRAHMTLKASGDSPAALLSSASGAASASLGGGTIASLLDAEMGLQGGKILRSMVAGSTPIAIRCAAVAIDLDHGAGRLRSLVLDTERTRTTGTGTIDLPGETVDLVFTPEAKQGGLFVLDRSIRVHGPLRQMAHELVDRAPPPASSGPTSASRCSCRTGSRSGRRRSRPCGCARRAPGSAP
jgi:uncharacterized protein involved in outer membrane biogenesis